jgi:hypothetical protein
MRRTAVTGAPRRKPSALTPSALRSRRAQMKRETLEQSHEAAVARGVGFDPYTLRRALQRQRRMRRRLSHMRVSCRSDDEQAFVEEQPYLPPRIDEPAYCEIRNHVRPVTQAASQLSG